MLELKLKIFFYNLINLNMHIIYLSSKKLGFALIEAFEKYP